MKATNKEEDKLFNIDGVPFVTPAEQLAYCGEFIYLLQKRSSYDNICFLVGHARHDSCNIKSL